MQQQQQFQQQQQQQQHPFSVLPTNMLPNQTINNNFGSTQNNIIN
jgi:hypothetical protein